MGDTEAVGVSERVAIMLADHKEYFSSGEGEKVQGQAKS